MAASLRRWLLGCCRPSSTLEEEEVVVEEEKGRPAPKSLAGTGFPITFIAEPAQLAEINAQIAAHLNEMDMRQEAGSGDGKSSERGVRGAPQVGGAAAAACRRTRAPSGRMCAAACERNRWIFQRARLPCSPHAHLTVLKQTWLADGGGGGTVARGADAPAQRAPHGNPPGCHTGAWPLHGWVPTLRPMLRRDHQSSR